MFPVVRVLAALVVVSLPLAGCRWRSLHDPFAAPDAAGEASLVWAAIPLEDVDVREWTPGEVRYRVHLPVATLAGGGQRLDVRFDRPLDGAKVDVIGEGKDRAFWLTLVHEKRVGGDTVRIPLTAARLDVVELVVHRHLRAPFAVREARLGAPRRFVAAARGFEGGDCLAVGGGSYRVRASHSKTDGRSQ